MARAKKIYILIIKVNKLIFSSFRRSVFYPAIQRTRKSCGNTRVRLVFPQHFLFSQTSTRSPAPASTKRGNMFSISFLSRATAFLYINVYYVRKLENWLRCRVYNNSWFSADVISLCKLGFCHVCAHARCEIVSNCKQCKTVGSRSKSSNNSYF